VIRSWTLPWALLGWALFAPAAVAWPVDLFVDVKVGQEHFTRFQGVDWVEVEDPKVASVEAFESGEVLVTGLVPGQTLVLLYGQGRFSVWRLRVAAEGARVAPPPADPTALKRACPGVEVGPKLLRAKVPDERCRLALRELLAVDGHRGEDLDLTFELGSLQTQLQDLVRGMEQLKLDDRVSLRYLGAGLVLRGAVTPQEHRRLLWEIFRRSAGRTALDDQLRVGPPDAGTP